MISKYLPNEHTFQRADKPVHSCHDLGLLPNYQSSAQTTIETSVESESEKLIL